MGITKSEIYSTKQNKLADMFKALAHPARIAIIQHLTKNKHCICVDLVDKTGLAQSTVSQHLVALRKIGIIKGCAEGTSISYCIDEKVWNRIQHECDLFFMTKKMTEYDCC